MNYKELIMKHLKLLRIIKHFIIEFSKFLIKSKLFFLTNAKSNLIKLDPNLNLFLNENYKKQIIDCISDLVNSSLKDKIFEDAYLNITKNEAVNLVCIQPKKDLDFALPQINNKLLLLSKSQSEHFEFINNKVIKEEIKIEVIDKQCQTEKSDLYEKLNIYLLNKKHLFKQEILQIENINKKQNEEFSFTAKIPKKKTEIKIVKRNRFENAELRLVNSYCSPSTYFHIKSNDLINLKTKNTNKAKNYYDSVNNNIINIDNKRKKSTQSLGDVNILKLNNNFARNKNLNSNTNNNNDNKSQIIHSRKQANRNVDFNSTFADKSNDISNNHAYMLCESVNNVYTNTNNQNDSSLEKTNNNDKANFTLNNSLEPNNNNISSNTKKTFKENSDNKIKENVKNNMYKINILENICSDCESDEKEKPADKANIENEPKGISIGIQTEDEIPNNSNNNKNKSNNAFDKFKTNKTLENLNNLNFDIQDSLINTGAKKNNTPKYANLYAPFSNKNSNITKKKEDLKIIIESYFSINSFRVNESLIIKPKSTPNILSPNRTIINPQPNNNNNYNSNNTNTNANNDLETFNNLNSSISTNIYNNNFHNYSRYLASGLSGNINEKVVSSSVLTGANNFNNLNNLNNNFNFNSNNNMNYQIENIEIPEKNYVVSNEVNFCFRKIRHLNENDVQTDLLSVIVYLFI